MEKQLYLYQEWLKEVTALPLFSWLNKSGSFLDLFSIRAPRAQGITTFGNNPRWKNGKVQKDGMFLLVAGFSGRNGIGYIQKKRATDIMVLQPDSLLILTISSENFDNCVPFRHT